MPLEERCSQAQSRTVQSVKDCAATPCRNRFRAQNTAVDRMILIERQPLLQAAALREFALVSA